MISGSVQKKGNRYYMVLELTDPATGKRKQTWRATGCTRKRDAEAKLHETLAELNRGTYVEPSSMTLAECLLRWVQEIAPLTASPRTCAGYESIIRHHLIPALGAVKLADLTPEMIQRYYTTALKSGRLKTVRVKENGAWVVRRERTGLPLSSTHVRQHHIVLRAALDQAVKWRKLVYNPTDDVVAPRARDAIVEAWTQDEARRFLEHAQERGSRFLDLYIFALGTGMRQSEILGLRWIDVDLERRLVSVRQTLAKPGLTPVFKEVPKTKKSRRTIDISESLAERLARIRATQDVLKAAAGAGYRDYGLVFAQGNGLPFDPANMVNRDFNTLVRALRNDVTRITFHGLRHTHLTDLMRRGISPKIVSERAGHSSVAFTMDVYGHVFPGMQREAAAAIDDLLVGADTERD